jgi:hypothetical protein
MNVQATKFSTWESLASSMARVSLDVKFKVHHGTESIDLAELTNDLYKNLSFPTLLKRNAGKE